MDDEKKEVKSDKGKTEISKYGRAILLKEYKALTKTPPEGISVGLVNNQIDEWEVFIQGPPDTLYEGGWFNANLKFPHDFPNNPPKMKFTTPNFWHPNVYKDGRVCISILHEAKEDELNPQERIDEKWRPIISVEAILVSVLSMLSDPNFESPANIDASVMMKSDTKAYKKRIRKLVRQTQDALL
jgi:ubiquitin-conjugating enzyme E2 G1